MPPAVAPTILALQPPLHQLPLYQRSVVGGLGGGREVGAGGGEVDGVSRGLRWWAWMASVGDVPGHGQKVGL